MDEPTSGLCTEGGWGALGPIPGSEKVVFVAEDNLVL